MINLMSVLNNTVSISAFNKGEAGRIFRDVKEHGAKVVMKNNTAECILMSPKDYAEIMDMIEDTELLETARERLENYDPDSLKDAGTVFDELGITDEMLEAAGEVEFE